ncbi:phosphoribosylamine--glycine ligase [Candidatus Saccharibacteria bacterium]|nr:phosphoribosylamine--glycine ligase [Candidatus Saccharibacteria bacterium]
MSKSVLVVGSGGREHALAWKLSQSNDVSKVYVAPGNGGTTLVAENVDISFTDVEGLLNFAREEQIDLTVIGQEAASEAGLVDAFNDAGLSIFGPTKAATLIESSKVFSKDLMSEQNIPTAQYKTFSDATKAFEYIKTRSLPIVIKADGLATGKGVIIPETLEQAEKAIQDIMIDKIFGEAGGSVVVEDFLKGQEVSMHALTDGTNSVIFPPSQDHKQVFDGDKGPNTGGMGVIAPLDWVKPEQISKIQEKVVSPALEGLKKKNSPFIGCLYPGLMLDGQDVNVIEFNARFGDPEAEVYMRLLDCDLYKILSDCAAGNLNPESVKWRDGYAATVVLASPGYPGDYPKGLPITGLEEAEKLDDIVVFHAGTALKDGNFVTAGGRVLNVTATGDTLQNALDKAYEAVKLINFEGMHYRTDIGQRV